MRGRSGRRREKARARTARGGGRGTRAADGGFPV